jgi:hypothetical protein
MKLPFFVLFFFISCHIFSQSGVYIIDHTQNRSDGTITKWTLTLKEDGSFLYHFLRDISGEVNPEENFYGKGTWSAKKNLVFFYTDKEMDLDEKYTVDFTNSKARYITKSSRDKSDKVVKTALRFYESDLFYIKGLQLFKE